MNNIITHIKSLQIQDIIGQYLTLSKKGANYTAPCPFHDEKTGSFTVSPSKGIYKCFGCGKGGDAIEFVKEFRKIDFIPAVKEICEKNAIEFDFEETKRSPEAQDRFIQSQNLISNVLSLHNEGRSKAVDYLATRNISAEIADLFQVGVSKPGIYNVIEKEQYDLAEELSLLTIRDGKAFDFLNNRLSYPIHSQNGTLLGISGRALNNTDTAKYINPRASSLYNKSKVLYGLYQAQHSIRENDIAILTEGAVDVWSAHEFGLTNTVATNGTALTEDQAKLLKGYCNKVILAFDNDKAGAAASEMAFIRLVAAGFQEIEILGMEDGHDLSDHLNANYETGRKATA